MDAQTADTKPYDLTTYDGRRVDWMTRQALEEAARRLGYADGVLTLAQGSYNAGKVSASAGTHDGGGVVDLVPYDWKRKVRVLRSLGFAAWHRTPDQGPWGEHIHAVQIGNAKLAPSAARQVTAYLAGRNGLANNGPDDGPRDYLDARWTWKPYKKPPQSRIPDGAPFTVAEQSGLWDAPLKSWQDALLAVVASGASVAGLTETTRATVLDAVPNGWDIARRDDTPGASECSLIWATSVWELVADPQAIQVAKTQFLSTNGKPLPPRHNLYVALKPIGSARVTVFEVGHWPTQVTLGPKVTGPLRRVKAYLEMRAGARKARRIYRRAYPGCGFVVMGDVNADARSATVRAAEKAASPGLRSTWLTLPKDGTHGRRIIDRIFVSRRQHQILKGGAVLLPKVPGFDHRGLVVSVQPIRK